MNDFLNSFHQINEKELDLESADPAFRKATTNMMAAYLVCKKATAHLSPDEIKNLSLVVSTQFGEVSSSLDFLTTFYETQIAKPILFQNSLHNSTLGFLAIQLGIQGPALTLSSDVHGLQATKQTAKSLLDLSENVLICFVDIVPDFLKPHYLAAYPELKEHLGWARAKVFTKGALNV